jgi:outer membrane protein OmpA-like peptidoglycan-associated protein
MSSNQPSYPVIESAKNLKRSFSGQRVVRERQQTKSVVYGFGINSSALLVEHTDMLEKNIVFLLEYPDSAVVSVVGRASQTGPEANNRQLARDRAGRVRDYLISSGVPEDRVGPVVFHGSEAPLVNVPGQENEMNRSVELVIDWVLELVDPAFLAGGTMNWNLNLSVTFGVGFGIGGQMQIGTLTNRTTDEHRPVSATILGLDLGKSLFITAAGSASGLGGLPSGNGGDFSMPTPPGPVGFDWFDGRFIVLTGVGVSAVTGVGVATLRFSNPDGPWPAASFVDYPLGVSVGVGGLAMIGFFNVDS